MRTGVALATSSVIGRALAVVAAAGLVLAPRPGRADDDDQDEKAANQGRVVIDRVEVEPSRLGLTRVRALVSAMELRGARIPFVGAGKNGIQVKVGSADTSDPLTGVFETSDVELALVVVLPVTGDFDVNGDLDPIREHLKNELLTPLGKLGPRAQFAVIGYAESTAGSRRLGNLGAATGALDKLEVDTSQANLIAAVQRGETMAKNAIKKPKVPGTLVRGIVVLVSDGSGVTVDDHEAITKLGLQAAKDHVRIDSLAYSPQARKRPLFALGELSRQSQGVFRWIRTMDGWTAALGQLVDEVQRETVVTFYAPPDQLADKKLSVTVPLAGNPIEAEGVKLPDAACGPDPCDGYCNHGVCIIPLRETSGGFLHWLLIGGAGIVGLGVIGIGGASLARRRKGAAPPFPPGLVPGAPGMPGMPGAPAMPGMPGAPAMPAMPGAAPAMAAYPGAPAMPGAAAAPPAGFALPPGTPIFIIVNGPNAGQRVPLKQGFTIGKAPGSDLDLSYDSFASGNHAMVTYDGGGWQLVDRGSTNGTFVNGNRVQTVRLDPGITVRLGSTEVRFGTA